MESRSFAVQLRGGCSLRGTEAAHEAGPVQETSMGMKDRKAFPKVTLSLTEPRTPQEGPVRAGLPVTGCLGGHEPRVTVPAWAQASCGPASSPPAITTSPRSPCPFHISDEETQAGPYLAGHQHDGSCLSWPLSLPTRVRHCLRGPKPHLPQGVALVAIVTVFPVGGNFTSLFPGVNNCRCKIAALF